MCVCVCIYMCLPKFALVMIINFIAPKYGGGDFGISLKSEEYDALIILQSKKYIWKSSGCRLFHILGVYTTKSLSRISSLLSVVPHMIDKNPSLKP